MAKFGRFEFKAQEPAEIYEGDYMEMDNRGRVRIMRRLADQLFNDKRLWVAIHLNKGESVRVIESDTMVTK
jgi:hypothetical protein